MKPPYTVTHTRSAAGGGFMHAFASVEGGSSWMSCCHLTFAGITRKDDALVACFQCLVCTGCFVCNPGHINDVTMKMGKWETKDGRLLYPFEMDSTHLMNSIKKLYRDKSHFKDDWNEWITCLEAEAKQRRLF